MQDYILTPKALDDLINIQDYIAQDNPRAAARIIDQCFDAFRKLAENPMIGHLREDLTSRDVRFWRHYSYFIVYDANTHPISIVRVLSGFRDISSVI